MEWLVDRQRGSERSEKRGLHTVPSGNHTVPSGDDTTVPFGDDTTVPGPISSGDGTVPSAW